jgi:lysophospholipase L1-like esterase
MMRAHRARRIAAAALYGGGGLGLVTAAAYGLLRGEAKLARRWIGSTGEQPPVADGTWGAGTGEPIRLAVLGDSSAAGLGVRKAVETPAVLLAAGLSEVAERPVALTNVAVVGARSADLAGQADRVLRERPHIVMIMIGTNDVTGRVPPAQSVRSLAEAVSRLRAAGAEVVVGTCPDLGTIEPIAQPLRLLARRWSRQMAAAQTVAVVEAGGRTVSLGDILGPEFAARPAEMFSPDRFHPSAAGYAAAAAVMLPSVSAALGLWPEAEADLPPLPFHREGVAPVATAAARAAGVAGTEVTPTRVDGLDRGPRGRWAFLRRRRPRLLERADFPRPDADAQAG